MVRPPKKRFSAVIVPVKLGLARGAFSPRAVATEVLVVAMVAVTLSVRAANVDAPGAPVAPAADPMVSAMGEESMLRSMFIRLGLV